ncbi:MAG: hypothetical protein WC523_03955 [Patescibacteria group bacterium]
MVKKFDIHQLSQPSSWVEYDSEMSDCHCDARRNGDYCRCKTVASTKITEICIPEIVNLLFKNTEENNDKLLKYCVNRILTYSSANEKEHWIVSVSNGYYGQETDGTYLDYSTVGKLSIPISELLESKSLHQRVLIALEWEYGYLLDSLKDIKSCTEVSVDPAEIIVPQQEYYRKMDKEAIEQYKDFDGPICICLKVGDAYKVVDGYHRLQANIDKSSINILVLE